MSTRGAFKAKMMKPSMRKWIKCQFEKIGGKCPQCGSDMWMPYSFMPNEKRNPTMLTIDHIIPLADGGTNKYSNLRLMCKGCNLHRALTT